MASFTPATNPQVPQLYGFESQVTGNTTVVVSPGSCTASNNVNLIVLNAPITLNTSTKGAGGLDVGTLAANTFYGIYAISDSTGFLSSTVLLSASYLTIPAMPTLRNGSGEFTTYDTYRLIGFCLTDGSANLILQNIVGKSCDKTTLYATSITIYNQAFTSGFITKSLVNAIPQLAISQITCQSAVSSTAGGSTSTYWRPTGSTITDDSLLRSVGGNNGELIIEDTIVNLISGYDEDNHVPAIDYSMSAAGSSYLKLFSYTFSL